MPLLSRDEILERLDLKKERVSVPEWGGDVLVTTMSGTARDEWEQSLVTAGGRARLDNVRARLLVFALVDEDGNQIFTLEDVEALGKKSATALERVVRVVQRLNSLMEADLETAKGN